MILRCFQGNYRLKHFHVTRSIFVLNQNNLKTMKKVISKHAASIHKTKTATCDKKKFTVEIDANREFQVLPTPIKSFSDKKEYKYWNIVGFILYIITI